MIRRIAAWLWPDTLAARVVLVLLAGLTLFHLGSLSLHQADTETALDATQEELLSEQIAGALRAITTVPADRRTELARALSTPNLDLRWTAERTLPIATPAGRRIIDHIVPALLELEAAMYAPLSTAERHLLDALLERIILGAAGWPASVPAKSNKSKERSP